MTHTKDDMNIRKFIAQNQRLANAKRVVIDALLDDLSDDISEAKQVISQGGFGAYPTEFSTSVSLIWMKIQELKNLENSIKEIQQIQDDQS